MNGLHHALPQAVVGCDMKRTSKIWPVDTGALKAACQSRLLELLHRLYPNRPITPCNNGFRVGNKGSLHVYADGGFYDHETGSKGDIIELVAHTLQTVFNGAVVFCTSFLGTPPCHVFQNNPHRFRTKRSDAKERIAKAKVMWGEGGEIVGTLAETYLRLRGITISLPTTLRFHHALWNHTTQAKHPALLACVQSPDGSFCGVHVVYLDSTGKKITGEGVRSKISYGYITGGAARLGAVADLLMLCEGIEDGLSLLVAQPDACIWATCGTSGMINVVLPDSVSEVVIAMDNDADGAGQKAANTLATRLKKEGRVARIATPAPYKDFNELLVKGLCHV